jgi:surface protein
MLKKLSSWLLIIFVLATFTINIEVKAAASDDFVTTWKTDNAGTSNSSSITIPTHSGSSYSYQVDWNNDQDFLDADETTLNTGNVTHDFGVAGTYTIRIKGLFPRIYFENTGDDEAKIIRVDQWGTNPWTSMELAFTGTPNLRITATDTPNLSGVTSLWGMFAGSGITTNTAMRNWDTSNVTRIDFMFNVAVNFNEDISGWDTGNITTMTVAINGATSFNQSLANWDMSSVTDATMLITNTALSADNYASTLNGWSTQALQSNVTLGAAPSVYCSNAANARANIISNFNWTITDGGATQNCDNGDLDGDGIVNINEDENGGDSNGDSIPDKTQAGVMNAYSPVSQVNFTLISSNSDCVFRNGLDVYSENTLLPSFQDNSYDYPLGLLSFRLECTNPGDSTTVKIIYDRVYDVSNAQFRKNKSGVGFINIAGGHTFGVENINGINRTTVTYNLQDGGFNDDDGIANGFILDPVGIANPQASLAATGMNIQTVLTWSISGLVLVFSIVASLFLFRTRKN